MAMFKKGYEAARQEKKRQEEVRESMNKRLFRFFLTGDGAEAKVRFLTEEPINFNEHTVKTYRSGKERYDNVLCCDDESCSLCKEGDKPSFKGAYLIWDYSTYESKDKNGKKKKVNGSLKLYVAGTRVLSQLDRLSNRYGLTSRDYEISRTGTGTDTSYMIERTDEITKLTKAQITNMLPEKLKEDFDGTMESLYSIIEEQIKLCLPKDSDFGGEDEDEDEDEEPPRGKNLVDYDEDEEMEDEIDEDEVPFKSKGNTSLRSKKSTLPKSKKPSIKGAFKSKR